ncbi:MAG TPA: hypothetical protein VEW46_10140 [Pyrinomonadaceae bacterium]|nr:hypothetical protein [Pyrinomonadaceae bacterium]
MRSLLLLIVLVLVATLSGQRTYGQTQLTHTDAGITPSHVVGELKGIDSAAKQLTVKTDAGSLVAITLGDSTSFSRSLPGETTLAKATKITLADLVEGDRVLAMGKVADDHKSATARTLVVMTKGDIAKKQEAEQLEWRRRGILGVISAVKPDTKEVTISTRNGMGSQPMIIAISDKVDARRYAPDSIKFSDARTSVFAELKVGDQVRALGEKSVDGTHFTPEKVVSGSFRTVAGTVTAVDTATGEIKVNDLQINKPLTIVIKADSVLRKFPAEMAAMMPGGGQGSSGPGTAGTRGAGGPNIQEMLDRLPTISTADLKAGDTIIVSSTRGADPTRVTAITLISGADVLLAMVAPKQQPRAGQTAPNPAGGLGSGVTFGIGLP